MRASLSARLRDGSTVSAGSGCEVAGYALIVVCKAEQQIVVRGRKILLPPGTYVYVGSANLKNPLKRVLRHFAKGKRIRWHIDKLTEKCQPLYAVLAYGVSEDDMYGLLVRLDQAQVAVPGFGSTDKRRHITHLFRIIEQCLDPEKVLSTLINEVLLTLGGKCRSLEIVSV